MNLWIYNTWQKVQYFASKKYFMTPTKNAVFATQAFRLLQGSNKAKQMVNKPYGYNITNA